MPFPPPAVVDLRADDPRGGRGDAEKNGFLGQLARLLLRLESCSGRDAGSLSLADPASGKKLGVVMAEEGRLCWATANDCPASLGRRLAEVTGLPPEQLEALYQGCKRSGSPLGETLVSRGLLTSEELRGLLAGQLGACLSTLLRATLEGEAEWTPWCAAPHRTYSPTFTFASGEVVDQVLAADLEARLGLPPVPEPMRKLLERSPQAVCLLIVSEPEGLALPVARGPEVQLTLTEMTELVRHGLALLKSLDTADGGRGAQLVCLHTETGGLTAVRSLHHLLLFRFEELRHVVPLLGWWQRRRCGAAEEPER